MTNGSAYVLFLPTDATVKTIFEIFLFLPFFIEKKKKKKKNTNVWFLRSFDNCKGALQRYTHDCPEG